MRDERLYRVVCRVFVAGFTADDASGRVIECAPIMFGVCHAVGWKANALVKRLLTNGCDVKDLGC